ncbi:heavy-metal-associated domain-containing protein [Microscilla marina]|uniref:Copper/potassium-transporting ATPase, putative n=1 Tax=Microscilla marina ATCC 23134 TaxID=313606 RepID=A1ZDD0_MICM2|nr:heavy metal-associated domain-containing protein [Microscilla marina]EAY31669.1 copper/potassium-transporting ATPase, putative [Microscilla marina ATCC 23134]
MKTHTFEHTNIKCAACEEKIQGAFAQEARIDSFQVDLQHADRPLTVQTGDNMTTEEVSNLIYKAGYEAKPAKKGLFKKLFNK